jgi:hypothetical protein
MGVVVRGLAGAVCVCSTRISAGSFQVSGKKERQGRNPRTGETITIAARNVAVFKPSKELSDRLSNSSENEVGNDVTIDGVAQTSEGSAKVHGARSTSCEAR